MKRKQFVPNSSSSSFIVLSPGEVTLTVDLNNYGTKVTTTEELETALVELWGTDWRNYYEDYENHYTHCIKLLKREQTLFIGNICSDSDDHIERLFYAEGFGQFKNLTVIQGG